MYKPGVQAVRSMHRGPRAPSDHERGHKNLGKKIIGLLLKTNCTKFGKLLSGKSLKLLPPDVILLLNQFIKFDFAWGSTVNPRGELTALPRPIVVFNWPTSREKQGEGRGREGTLEERRGPKLLMNPGISEPCNATAKFSCVSRTSVTQVNTFMLAIFEPVTYVGRTFE